MKTRQTTVLAASALFCLCSALPCGAQSFEVPEGPAPARAFEAPYSWDGPRGDGRRTLGAFPKNLGRNFIGVFSGQNLVPLAIGAAATAATAPLDSKSQELFLGACEPCGKTGATVGGGASIVPVVGMLFAAGRFAPQGPFRAASYDFAQALIVNGVYTGLLKYGVQRTRPDGSDNLSFPSGHTSTFFSLATVADHHYGWKVGVPAYLVASGVGLSRIESNKHHLSDVLAGATLGVIVGRTVARLDGERPPSKRVLSFGPVTDPQGQGFGVGLSASW